MERSIVGFRSVRIERDKSRAEAIGMRLGCDYPDEANGTAHASAISKEDWLSEIGAEVIKRQKEGLQDGI